MKLHWNLSLLVVGLSLIAVCFAARFELDEESDESEGIGGGFGAVRQQQQQQQQQSVKGLGGLGGLGFQQQQQQQQQSIKGVGGLGGVGIKQQQQQQQQQSIKGVGGLGGLGGYGTQQQQQQQSVKGVGGLANQVGLGGLANGIGGFWQGAQNTIGQGLSNFQGGLSEYGFGSKASSGGGSGKIFGDIQEAPAPGVFGVNLDKIAEWSKLLFKPFELVKAIASHFQLDLEKFIFKIGDGLVFGTEAMVSPFVSSIKIMEKIFKPDACRLRLFCGLGSNLRFMKSVALRFSPTFLGSSLTLKAFSEGVVGSDCDLVYVSCDPKLNLGIISGARSIQSLEPKTQATSTNETKNAN